MSGTYYEEKKNLKTSQSLTIFIFFFAYISPRVICKRFLKRLMEQNIWTSIEDSSVMRVVSCMYVHLMK